MATIEEVVQQFNQLPLEIQLECSSDEFLSALHALETTYNVSLASVVVQMVVGHIQFSDLSDYLEAEYSIGPEVATRFAKELEEKVFKPTIDRLNFLDTNPEKTMTLEQQKNFAENLFRSNLLKELHHHPFIISAINDRLFYLLARDENFHTDLERALYENNETVGTKPIRVNNEVISPTIGHWIKNYIAQHGTTTADSISQSTFLINSENAKNLSDDERALLSKVLKVYGNVKFFPDSMPSDDGRGWEIIPGGSDEIEIAPDIVSAITETQTFHEKSSTIINNKTITPNSITNQSIQKSTAPVIKPQPVVTPIKTKTVIKPSNIKPVSKPVTPIIKNEPKMATTNNLTTTKIKAVSEKPSDELLALKNMLLQYPPNSLERQAIEDEISKLEQDSK